MTNEFSLALNQGQEGIRVIIFEALLDLRD